MNLFKMMQTGEGIEHLEEHLLNLDSEFRFKCRRCGKCCIHQETIIFNARDIYNIAKKKGMTVQEYIAYQEAKKKSVEAATANATDEAGRKKAYQKAYREAHREEYLEYQKAYHQSRKAASRQVQPTASMA